MLNTVKLWFRVKGFESFNTPHPLPMHPPPMHHIPCKLCLCKSPAAFLQPGGLGRPFSLSSSSFLLLLHFLCRIWSQTPANGGKRLSTLVLGTKKMYLTSRSGVLTHSEWCNTPFCRSKSCFAELSLYPCLLMRYHWSLWTSDFISNKSTSSKYVQRTIGNYV